MLRKTGLLNESLVWGVDPCLLWFRMRMVDLGRAGQLEMQLARHRAERMWRGGRCRRRMRTGRLVR